MKVKIVTLLCVLSGLLVMQSFVQYGKRDGTEPGHTGSPGDGKNCTVCHGGEAVPVDGWITSSIPASGFVPGQRYTIRATNTRFGHTRFGFQVSPQDIQGNLLGTLVITDTVTTKLVGNDKYVTYRADGVIGVDSLSWVFDWVAPNSSVNEVVFYGAFNSNHDGHKGGDITQLSTLRVFKQGFTGLRQTMPEVLEAYPNPANLQLTLTLPDHASVSVYAMDGTQIHTPTYHSANGQWTVETAELKSGLYLLRAQIQERVLTQKIMVLH